MERRWAAVLLWVWVVAGCSAESPRVRLVAPADLRAWLADDPGPAVIDVRILYDWQHAHIPGARPIPGALVMDPETEALIDGGSALTTAVPDLATRVVFYCSGSECDVSGAVAAAAVRIGYRDVWKLDGGFPAWTAAGYEAAVTVADFCTVPYFPLDPANELADVRPAAEFAAGAIPGAVNVPRDTFLDPSGAPLHDGDAFRAAVTADAGLDFLLADSAADARAVARFAADAGYRNVRLLEGTWTDWTATACAAAAP